MSPRGLEVRREGRSRSLEANHASVCVCTRVRVCASGGRGGLDAWKQTTPLCSCTCVCMCTCVRTCVCIRREGRSGCLEANHASVCAHVYVYACVHVCARVCVSIRREGRSGCLEANHASVCVCAHVCVCVHPRVCVCTCSAAVPVRAEGACPGCCAVVVRAAGQAGSG